MFKSTCPVCRKISTYFEKQETKINCKACNSVYNLNTLAQENEEIQIENSFSDTNIDDISLDEENGKYISLFDSNESDEDDFKASMNKIENTEFSSDLSIEEDIFKAKETKSAFSDCDDDFKIIKNKDEKKPVYLFDSTDSEDDLPITTKPAPFDSKYSWIFSDSDEEIVTANNKKEKPLGVKDDNLEISKPKPSSLNHIDSKDNLFVKSSPNKESLFKRLSDSKEDTKKISDIVTREQTLRKRRKTNIETNKMVMDYNADNDSELVKSDDDSSMDESYKPIGNEFSDAEISEDEMSEEEEENQLLAKQMQQTKIELYKKGELNVKKRKKETLPRLIQKSSENKKKYTPKPLSRYNPYMMFLNTYRTMISDLRPGLSSMELSKVIGAAYNELDAEAKSVFNTYANNKSALAKKELPVVIKAPPNGFILFKNMNSKKFVSEIKDFGNASKFMAEKWKELPPDEKKTYQMEAKKRMEEFKLNNPQAYKSMVERRSLKNVATKKKKQEQQG